MEKLAVVVILLLWAACNALGDLESCCNSGETLALRTGACVAPPGQPGTDRRCAAARRMCCVHALRKATCEQGKRAARQGRPCESTLDTFKDCCDACTMGLQSNTCDPPFSLGSPWDEAFQDCCPKTTQKTENDRCQTENPCSQKCEDVGGVEVRCSCEPGFKLALDRTTCIDVDECVEGGHTCSPINETCVNSEGGFECQHKISCPPGFNFNPLRSTCDDIDECRNGVCPPGHKCHNSVGSFSCIAGNSSSPCPRGFEQQADTGRCIDVDECQRGTHGCDPSRQMCQNSHGAYQCVARSSRAKSCPAGFKWERDGCTDVDECVEGLTNCRDPEERCRNTVGGYECDPACPVGLTLDPRRGTCSQLQQQLGSGCSSSAECDPDETCSGGLCVKRATSRGRCPPGYKPSPQDDLLCTDVDECSEYPDVCDTEKELCRNEEGRYECVPCPPGHRSDGQECNDIDECSDGTDNCDRRIQRCINTEGGFQCAPLSVNTRNTCPPGYRVNPQNGSCQDIDECAEGRHRCQPGREQCQNVAGAYRCQDISVSRPLPCPPGTRLEPQTDVCEDVDECSERSDSCERSTQECVNTVGSFRCVPRIVCPHGYSWSESKRKCEDVNECLVGGHDCDPRSERCVNTPGSFQCQSERPPPVTCGTGFAFDPNTDTCADINECDLLRPCTKEQSCRNTEGSYRCICHQGYTLDPVTTQCIDVNECQLRLHECTVSQRCDNTIGSYTCVRIAGCGTGYTLNAHTSECEDDDECVLGTHNCGQGFACRNTAGSFRCVRLSCPAGHRLLPDNTCQAVRCPSGLQPDNSGQCVDVNECGLPDPVCRPNQRCVNTQGSFRCHNLLSCGPGFELNEQGDQCVDVDECERKLAECFADQTCKNRPGGYVCSCPKGYNIGTSRYCEDVDECSQFGSQVCASNSECINTQGSYTCNCKDGFRSSNNDKSCLDIDECSETPNICQQTCNNVWGSYQCSCKLGYTLAPDQRSCQDIDECAVYGGIGKLCIGFCVNEPGSFKCSCPQGYILASDGRTCQDIDECAQEGVCNDPKAVCLNTRGGYKCNIIDCPPNYVRDKDHKNRCKPTRTDCAPGAPDCLKDPLSLSFNYITFVSRLQLPLSGAVDLFTMRGPRLKATSVSFNLEMANVRARQGIPAATQASFQLRRTSYNEALVSLVSSLQGPQDLELHLKMNIYHKGLFAGMAVAKIYIFVTEHEF